MTERPYTVLSCCMSLDGYLDDGSQQRLVLSNDADLDRVDALRADCDAILVGAGTVRSDNPRLLVRDPVRIAARLADGRPPTPTKVTVTALGKLEVDAAFFSTGDTEKLVYCGGDVAAAVRDQLGDAATVVDCGERVGFAALVADLHARGVRRLLVEGGGTVLGQFLADELADELQLAIAPFLVGDSTARRFLDDGPYPWTPTRRAALVGTRALDDVVLLRYALSDRCRGTDGEIR